MITDRFNLDLLRAVFGLSGYLSMKSSNRRSDYQHVGSLATMGLDLPTEELSIIHLRLNSDLLDIVQGGKQAARGIFYSKK